MKTVKAITGKPRRQHDRACKADLVSQCLVPGTLVAAVALAGGFNANLLFKWRRDHLRSQQLSRQAASSSTLLAPVQIASGMDVEAGSSQLSVPTPTSTGLAVAPQRALRQST